MRFDQWLKNARNRMHVGNDAFASHVGVGPATIYSLEHSQSDVTLPTAVQISMALNANLLEHLDIGKETNKQALASGSRMFHAPLQWRGPLNVWEVMNFGILFNRAQVRAYQHLTELFNHILDDAGQNPDCILPQTRFSLEDIQKILFLQKETGFEIPYPSKLTPDRIRELFLKGGVVTWTDASIYIKKVRQDQKVSQGGANQQHNHSPSVLSRIESGQTLNVKLKDIVAFDKALNQDGVLLGLVWNAVYFEILGREYAKYQYENNSQTRFIIDFFLDLYRLQLGFRKTNNKWLDQLRQACIEFNMPRSINEIREYKFTA